MSSTILGDRLGRPNLGHLVLLTAPECSGHLMLRRQVSIKGHLFFFYILSISFLCSCLNLGGGDIVVPFRS